MMPPTRTVAVALSLVCGVTLLIQGEPEAPPDGGTRTAAPVACLGSKQFVHRGGVGCLGFSPDGSVLFALSGDEACLWDVTTGKRRHSFRLKSSIMGGALSRDGRIVVLAQNGPQIHIFNATNGQYMRELVGAKSRSSAVAMTADGRLVASRDGKEAILWDAGDGKELRRWSLDGEYIKALRFSPDGGRLATASSKAEMSIHDLEGVEKPVKLVGGTGFTAWLAFAPDGKTLAGSCEDRFPGGSTTSLRIWDATTGKVRHKVPGSFGAGAFSPDGKCLAASEIGDVHLYDTTTGRELRLLLDSNERVRSVAFSPDGKMLATAQGRRIRLWDTRNWRETPTGTGHSEPVQAVAFSPDGRTLATGGLDGQLILWAWPEAKERRRIKGGGSHWGIRHLTFSPDGRTLAATAWINRDDTFFLFDAATGALVSRFGKENQGRGPVIFLPGGKEVVTAQTDGSLAVWDSISGKLRRTVGRHKGSIHAVRPVPGTGTVWWAGEYQGLGLLNLTTGKDVRALTGATHHGGARLAVSPDGDWLAVGRRVWDLRSNQVIADGRDVACTVSPDGRLLAAARPEGRLMETAKNGGVTFWEALTHREIDALGVGMGDVYALAFSPDGTVLAAAGYVGVRVWDMTGCLQNGRLPERVLTLTEMESLWQALGGDDAWAAHQAAWILAAGGENAVAFLSERLRPAPAPDPIEIEKLRVQLLDPDHDVREIAARKLVDLGIELLPDEREALRRPDPRYASSNTGAPRDGARPPVVRCLPPPVLRPILPKRIRCSRAVAALERNGGTSAESLLVTLAKGRPTLPLTREAKAALARTRQRRLRGD